jgi:hypothetical protein
MHEWQRRMREPLVRMHQLVPMNDGRCALSNDGSCTVYIFDFRGRHCRAALPLLPRGLIRPRCCLWGSCVACSVRPPLIFLSRLLFICHNAMPAVVGAVSHLAAWAVVTSSSCGEECSTCCSQDAVSAAERAQGWDGRPRVYNMRGRGVPPGPSMWRSVGALCPVLEGRRGLGAAQGRTVEL